MSERTHFVYRAWDSEGRCLYVGCTGNPTQRRANHRSTSAWFPYATRTTMSGPYTKRVAFEIEKAEIAERRPYFNALPEHALMSKRRNKRWSELHDQMQNAAGLVTRKQKLEAILEQSPSWDAINVAVEAVLDAEFDLRCTHMGRIQNYRRLIGEVAA